jgi:hypothetical protein
MATDLGAYIVTREPGFWGWLVLFGGNLNLVTAHAFVNLTWALAVFLSAIILLEGTIVVFVRSKIDAFTKEALNQLY